NMVDYACARTLDYIAALGDGERFTTAGVNDDFFNGTSALYPIPFVNVMIGTFMLEALRGAADVHDALARLKLDWPQAMALVMSRAGSNVSSSLTEGTNWLVLFLNGGGRHRPVHDPHEAFAARRARDALENGGVLDGAGTGAQEVGRGGGRHSRPDRGLPVRRRRLSRGDAEVGSRGAAGTRLILRRRKPPSRRMRRR